MVRRNESAFACVFLGLLAFAIHKSALHGYWRFDDGAHLKFAALYAPWQYFLQPSVMLLQSYANVTPYNALFFDINLSLFGMEPKGHYAHLVVILAAIAFSTYRLLRLWQGQVPALLASVLFLGGLPTLHVAQQLMTGHYATGLLFTILSLHSFALGVRQNHRGLVLVGAALYLLATTCKEVYVPLLLVLPAIPVGVLRERVRAALPYLLVAMLYTVWRYAVLGKLMGGYIATEIDPGVRLHQMLSIPLLLGGWLNGLDLTDYFLGRGGAPLFVALGIMALLVTASIRKRISWPLMGTALPLLMIPLLPLTGYPGVNEADRYLFFIWWACSVLLATVVGSLKDAGAEGAFRYLVAFGFVAFSFNVQLEEHARIAPRLAREESLYQTILHANDRTALMPPQPRDYYKGVLSDVREAASLYLNSDLGPAKLVVDKASLCKYSQQANTILEFDETCNCMKDSTNQLGATFEKLQGQEMHTVSGIPLSVRLALHESKLQWELGPFVDGTYFVVFGSSPTKVPAQGGIPWVREGPLQFRVRHDSPDGIKAISPSLEFDVTKQAEFSWQGRSVVEAASCASGA